MTITTDTLVKPDMRAVLKRTHLSRSLHDFLLPVLEAISNGIHGIEARFATEAATKGKIAIKFENPNDPKTLTISIADNGLGLDETNYKSFKTPFSGHKLKQNGRGFGRFIAFKVFSKITYATKYEFFQNQNHRHFRFDIYQENEISFINTEPEIPDTGVQVIYQSPMTDWNELIRNLKTSDIAEEIGSHFLPQFLYGWLPEITVSFDDGKPENITHYFGNIFKLSDSGSFECEVEGETETLSYSIAKIPKTRLFKSHCLLLSAADRIVGKPRDLTNKLGQPHFTDENNEKYIVISVVTGEAFESRLNDARTGINITSKTIENIVSSISKIIQKDEVEQIEKIKSEQSIDLNEALRENPILRIGLKGRTLGEYVSSKPNNWTAEEFISDLAIERHRATNDLSKAIVHAANDAENYEKNIKEIVGKLDENNKEALAEYIIHRKNIIELVEAARKFGSDGNRAPEDVIHDLIFRRFTDSTQTGYFEHNLWLIDDVLAFLPYVSSDRTIHGGRRKKGDKITDIAFFDESLVLGDSDGTTITIVEFKKPSRDDFRLGNDKSDPVLQIINTLEQATAAGGISRTDGTHFSFGNVTRRFAYLIADHTASLVKVLRKHDFRNQWNSKIYFRFRDNEQIYIQAFGYDTLVENAKKRNQAFFTVLLGE
ncbi:hypothetical protein ABVF61_13830 [Roseibium sp. HPY-6]|uniref:hypothetical protein n=1 Tax=Roseibium sp. HPY-6 TaxID=3229852 RepID=UPI00338E2006